MKLGVITFLVLMGCSTTSLAQAPAAPAPLFAIPPRELQGHKLKMCLQDYEKEEQMCFLVKEQPYRSCMIMIDRPGETAWKVGLVDCETGDVLPPPKDA